MTSKPAQTDSLVDDLVEGLTEIIATLAVLVWRLLLVAAGNPIPLTGAAGVWATLRGRGLCRLRRRSPRLAGHPATFF